MLGTVTQMTTPSSQILATPLSVKSRILRRGQTEANVNKRTAAVCRSKSMLLTDQLSAYIDII